MQKAMGGPIKKRDILLMHGDDYYVSCMKEKAAACQSGRRQETRKLMQNKFAEK